MDTKTTNKGRKCWVMQQLHKCCWWKVKFIRRGDFWDESQRIHRICLAYMGRKGTLHMGSNEMMSRERSTLGHVWWLATGKMVLNQSDAYALQTFLTRASVIVFLPLLISQEKVVSWTCQLYPFPLTMCVCICKEKESEIQHLHST